MQFPDYRPRRLRKNENFRRMIRETRLSVDNLIYPLFVVPGTKVKKPITSMPGNFQMSVDHIVREAARMKELGIPAVLLFGIPEKKDEIASGALAKDGIIQQAIREIKDKVPDILVITDVCLCEYMSHGHCGMIEKGEVMNDLTLEVLAEQAVSHAKAGADMVAPSAMMDGQIGALREGLDEAGFDAVPIMAYSAKYASCFYGPFREAAERPAFGDRRAYQMDPANSDEAMPGDHPRCGGGGGHHHGEARPGLSGCHPPGEGGVRPAAGRLQRERRICDGQGGGADGLDRRRAGDAGVADGDPARRGGHDHHLFRPRGGANFRKIEFCCHSCGIGNDKKRWE